MRRQTAYSFRSPLAIVEIRSRLNAAGPWCWNRRDSEAWGDYIYAGVLPKPLFGVVKILSHGARYELNIMIDIDHGDPSDIDELLSSVSTTVVDSILPSIQADDIQPTEPSER